jgi:hypothetical protein
MLRVGQSDGQPPWPAKNFSLISRRLHALVAASDILSFYIRIVVEMGRNRKSTAKRALLLRVGVNLRLKKESLKSVKAALGMLDPDNPLV